MPVTRMLGCFLEGSPSSASKWIGTCACCFGLGPASLVAVEKGGVTMMAQAGEEGGPGAAIRRGCHHPGPLTVSPLEGKTPHNRSIDVG